MYLPWLWCSNSIYGVNHNCCRNVRHVIAIITWCLSISCFRSLHVHGSVLWLLCRSPVENGVNGQGRLEVSCIADCFVIPRDCVWRLFLAQLFHLGQEIVWCGAVYNYDRHVAAMVWRFSSSSLPRLLLWPKEAGVRKSGSNKSNPATNPRATVVHEQSGVDANGWNTSIWRRFH